MKYSYWFEDETVLFFDHELTIREFYALVKKHGFLVGYTKGDEIILMDDACG